MPKFINGTSMSRRSPSDTTRHPFGKPVSPVVASPNEPPKPPSAEEKLKDLLKSLEPEPSQKLRGRLLQMSAVPSPDAIKREVGDILAILNGLHKK